jgi:hypothetical protein
LPRGQIGDKVKTESPSPASHAGNFGEGRVEIAIGRQRLHNAVGTEHTGNRGVGEREVPDVPPQERGPRARRPAPRTYNRAPEHFLRQVYGP